MTSPANPPRSPAERSLKQKVKKPQSHRLPLDQNRKARPMRRGRKHRDDVRDGKFFHVRVSLGYLTSLRNLKMDDNIAGDSLLSVFASFTPKASERGEYNFATSLPLQPDVVRQTVKWPKGTDVVTSKRRLYHSVILRSDDLASEENRGLNSDDDESTEMLSPAPYAPAFVHIYVGLKRGDETVSIGVATLVISGRPVKNQKLDLPVKNLALPKSKSEEMQNISKRSVAGLKSLFGASSKKSAGKHDFEDAAYDLAVASDGTKRYAFEKTAVLQIKLDTVESVHQSNGPGLWGDLEDDEESFGPIPVIDIPDDYTVDLTNRYQHESIEVMQFKQGTTIISSPGHGEVEESGETYVELGDPKSPTEIITSRREKLDPYEDNVSGDSTDVSGEESCSHDSVSDIDDSEYGTHITNDDCTNEDLDYVLDRSPDSISHNVSSYDSSRKYESAYQNSVSKSADFTGSFGDESYVEGSDASQSSESSADAR